jgi:hypothetical protein
MNTARMTPARLTAVAVATLTALYVGVIAPARPASAATFVPLAGAGSATSTLGADLTLAIPPAPGSAAGSYAGSLNISAVDALS